MAAGFSLTSKNEPIGHLVLGHSGPILKSGIIPPAILSSLRKRKPECYYCENFEGLLVEQKRILPKISLTVHRCWSALVLEMTRQLMKCAKDLQETCKIMERALEYLGPQVTTAITLSLDFPVIELSLEEETQKELKTKLEKINGATILLTSRYIEVSRLVRKFTEMIVFFCAMMTQLHMSFTKNSYHKQMIAELHTLKTEKLTLIMGKLDLIDRVIVTDMGKVLDVELKSLADALKMIEMWDDDLVRLTQAAPEGEEKEGEQRT